MHLRLGKQHGMMRKTKHRGTAVLPPTSCSISIAYNLIRIPKLVSLLRLSADGLGPVGIHREFITAATRWIIEAKL
jgi:hypothetical protein